MNEIGKMMYDRRKELGYSLEYVGNYVGVGKSTVRKWENGMIKNMGRDKIALLAKVLQLSPVDFVPVDGPQMTDDEVRLLAAYRAASPDIREAALDILEKSAAKNQEKATHTENVAVS
ncbi:MAG: helix-turn-helix transcriptional regulator [Clostridia bacterium]|nr:helix-turn-helix transcriptional regulator [Clostridia bacterium]